MAQIEKADDTVRKKRVIFKTYEKFLKPVSEFFHPLMENREGKSNYWHVAFRMAKPEYDVNRLRKLLAQKGIETRTFFLPMHLQPVYRNIKNIGNYPNSELLAKTGLLLPSGSSLDSDKIEKISSVITEYFKK